MASARAITFTSLACLVTLIIVVVKWGGRDPRASPTSEDFTILPAKPELLDHPDMHKYWLAAREMTERVGQLEQFSGKIVQKKAATDGALLAQVANNKRLIKRVAELEDQVVELQLQLGETSTEQFPTASARVPGDTNAALHTIARLRHELVAMKHSQQEMLSRAATIADRPDLAALLVSSWDHIDSLDGLPDEYQGLADKLMTCIKQVDYRLLPDIDALVTATCKDGFAPWRRGSAFGKLAYCLGKLPSVQSFMDTFLGFGGTAIIAAQGMIDAGKQGATVTGWETDADTIQAYRHGVESKFPNVQLRAHPTLNPGSVLFNNATKFVEDATGDLITWCRQAVPDVAFVDAQAGTPFMAQGTQVGLAEALVVYQLCKPRFILQASSNLHPTVAMVRELALQRSEYQSVIVGTSHGVGCAGDLASDHTIELLVKVNQD